MKNNLNNLYEDMQKCQRCNISRLTVNHKDVVKGYGKLIGEGLGSKYMFVLQNPSIHRFSNCVSPVDENDKGIGAKFRELLKEIDVWKDSFVTNLCKCSTLKNHIPKDDEIDRCIEILQAEISIIRPKKIIACGRYTHDMLRQYYIKGYRGQIDYLPHPSYYFHYNKNKVNTYKTEIIEVCQI